MDFLDKVARVRGSRTGGETLYCSKTLEQKVLTGVHGYICFSRNPRCSFVCRNPQLVTSKVERSTIKQYF